MSYRKYHNQPTRMGNVTFPSLKEARRYRELQLMERIGDISGLTRQVRYMVIPAQYDHAGDYGEPGKCLERRCDYIADFVYYRNGKLIVEDTKGKRTPEYIIKRKLMLQVYGIRILET